MKHTTLALAISTSLFASSIYAAEQNGQNEENEIEKMVVVSSRVSMPLREIATSVSIITQQDIDARGYANLTDVLKIQPAISATNSGGVGSTTALRVRGEEGYRTLVRIDGVDISDPTGTQVGPQLAHLQSSNIARVEILRGSQGLAYGADAGGVINIYSGSPSEQFSGNLSGEFGGYNSRNLSANMGANHEDFDYFVAASDYQTDGFNSRLDDPRQDKDGYENTTIHSRLGVQINDDLSLGLVFRNNQGLGQFDNCGFGASASNDCESEFNQSNLRADLNYSTDKSQHELAYAKTLIERENFNQGLSDFLTKGVLQRVEYLGNTQLNQEHQLVYGFDWEEEQITTAEQSRISTGYYFEYQGELLDNLYITAGVRHDDNEDFGEHTSVRVSGAYIWTLGDDEIKLRSAYGTGFRAPSLFEVEYNRGPYAFAPAATTALQEETTKGYEIALEYSTKQGSRFEVIYFDQTIEDSIFFDLAGYSGYLQDLGQSSSEGAELIADVKVSDALRLNLNYTYNQTKDTAGEQRLRRPKNMANIGFDYQIDKLTLSANLRLVQDFVDLVLDETTFESVALPLDNYEVIDISARYRVNTRLTVFARVENLFDKSYQDLAAFNTAGDTPHIGLKYQF
ncbi:TonB-dependent receptor [uncultured Paraglaciecola sp.]|uniref:TonB-dependent receptor plug domain-containing protein n=1 Tax=uncultured Paraglaciecola sp. TaxID=1765024 RepID=UPI0025F4002F|nr:TonB-dependent receptor [uncultured Paraglaciecola sp.]